MFTECLLYGRHKAKHFMWINSLNPHKSIRWMVFSPHNTDEKVEVQTDRFSHTWVQREVVNKMGYNPE